MIRGSELRCLDPEGRVAEGQQGPERVAAPSLEAWLNVVAVSWEHEVVYDELLASEEPLSSSTVVGGAMAPTGEVVLWTGVAAFMVFLIVFGHLYEHVGVPAAIMLSGLAVVVTSVGTALLLSLCWQLLRRARLRRLLRAAT